MAIIGAVLLVGFFTVWCVAWMVRDIDDAE